MRPGSGGVSTTLHFFVSISGPQSGNTFVRKQCFTLASRLVSSNILLISKLHHYFRIFFLGLQPEQPLSSLARTE